MTLFEKIGPDRIRAIVYTFYERAFQDPMLAHFFIHTEHAHLVDMQSDFVFSMLGGPTRYRGQAIEKIHDSLLIRPSHFRRRQRILQESMHEHKLDNDLAEAWLRLEERLKPLIVKDQSPCSGG